MSRVVVFPTILLHSFFMLMGCSVVHHAENEVSTNQFSSSDMYVADEIERSVSNLEGVKTATVILNGRNAYVAPIFIDHSQTESGDSITRIITKDIKNTNPDIKHVYVSTDPDFIEHMQNYTREIEQGMPASGLVDDFNNLIKYIFS